MALIGLHGEYLVGIKLFSPDKEALKEARNQQMKTVANQVKSKLESVTIADIVDTVKGDKSVSSLLQGFDAYKGANLGTLKNLMKPESLSKVVGMAIKGYSAAARVVNPIENVPKEEVDLGLRENDFMELKVQEYLGVLLPMYSVSFTVRDRKLYKVMNKNSKLQISFGRTESDLVTFDASIFKVIIKDEENGGLVTLRGYLDAPGFITQDIRFNKQGNSFELMKEFLQDYKITLKSNIDPEKFKDAMTWRASTSRPIEFLVDMWKHCFVSPESQIAPTILATGEFLWTDLSEARKLADTDEYKFQYADRVIFKQNPFYANFGSGRNQRFTYTTDTNSMEMLNLNDTNSAVTSESSKIEPMENRIGKYSVRSPEMHENWFLAELLNCSRLFSSMTQTAWIRPELPWKQYKPTDIITLKSIDSPDAGQYLVTGRIAHIQVRKFNTWLQIARDNYSAITGTDLKK